GRRPPIHLPKRPAIPRGFVFQLPLEFVHAHIAQGFSDAPVGHHAPDVERFHGNEPRLANQRRGEFVQPVLPTLPNLGMSLGCPYSLTMPANASLALAG
ncbi:hypothetical protein HW44_16170, partial [Nitrosococcus oceani]